MPSRSSRIHGVLADQMGWGRAKCMFRVTVGVSGRVSVCASVRIRVRVTCDTRELVNVTNSLGAWAMMLLAISPMDTAAGVVSGVREEHACENDRVTVCVCVCVCACVSSRGVA